MSEMRSPALPTTAPQPARQRVPKKIREAIDAIAFGRARTKKIAAEKFGHISREYFSRSFQKPAVAQYAKEAAARAVAMGAMRAAAVLNELADCSSQRVRLEAAKTSLQAAGIVGGGQNVSVNVGVAVAGWVIDLRDDRGPLPNVATDGKAGVVVDAPKAIDSKPAE